MSKQTIELVDGKFGVVDTCVTIADYVEDAKKEMEEKVRLGDAKLHNKISNSVSKSKETKVKYWIEGLPEDKKDPLRKKMIEKLTPKYAHDGDIGMDLIATSMEYDVENDRYIYHTGFYCETDKEDGCFVFPRSSNSKTDCYLANGVGIVDSFIYRGEVMVVFKNRTSAKQRLVELLLTTWISMPWYKKVFTNFSKWSKENVEEASKVINEVMENEAPYEVGDKIAQLVWFKTPKANMTLLSSKDKFTKSDRGEGGFGSTGK